MKNKSLLLIIFSFFAFQTGKSQNAFPAYADSAKWNVYHCVYGMGSLCNTLTYQYDRDTLFCGHVYSKIKTTTTGAVGYVRSDSSHVYIRATNSCSGKEYLMYDFSITIGDTIYVANNIWDYNPSDTTRFVLDSSKTINFSGVNRRIYFVRYEPDPDLSPGWFGRSMTWIEGIGSTTNPFFPVECISDYCESSWQLLCFDSLSVQLYQDAAFKTCDTTFTDVSINDLTITNHLNIFPNPFNDNLTISVDNATLSDISLFNVFGECVYSWSGNGKNNLLIDNLSKIPAGAYFIKAKTDKGFLNKKIVRIK